MKYSVSIHELAESELNDAVDFYESKIKGLGSAFLSEVERATAFIQQYPESSPRILNVIRKKSFADFRIALCIQSSMTPSIFYP